MTKFLYFRVTNGPLNSGPGKAFAALAGLVFLFGSFTASAQTSSGAAAPAPAKPINELAFGDEDLQKIAAIVNDTPITEYDVYQRLALIVSQTGFQLSEDDVKQMREQVLRNLIDETIKIDEANNFDVRPEPGEIDAQLQEIAMQNNMTVSQIEEALAAQNIRLLTLQRQLAAEIVWQTIVSGRFRNSISITKEEIDAVYQRTAANANKPQYRVFEIQIRVDSPDQEAEIRNGMMQLRDQIRQGADFRAVAQQISHSPSATQGGDMGWVQDGQLASELNIVLRTMNKGDISLPIRTITGYYVLMLADRRIVGGADPLKSKLTMQQIVFPVAPEASPEDVQSAGSYLLQAAQTIKSCDELVAMKERFPNSEVSERQTLAIGEVSEVFQTALIPLQPGEASAPILTNQGFHVIGVCDREDTDTNLPSREQIENQLANQQMTMMARRYIRDLRNDAVVEIR